MGHLDFIFLVFVIKLIISDKLLLHVTEVIKTQAKVRTGSNKMAASSPKNRKRKTEDLADSPGTDCNPYRFPRTLYYQTRSRTCKLA